MAVASVDQPRIWIRPHYASFNGVRGIAVSWSSCAITADRSRTTPGKRLRWISALGLVSYGFYVYHAMPSATWEHLVVVHPKLENVIPFVVFAVTALISWASFRFYESPFLRLKSRLAPQAARHKHVSEPQPAAESSLA